MNFLIVVPRFVKKLGQHYTFPLGLAYISSSLKANGFNVDCLNLNHYDDPIEELLFWRMNSNAYHVLCTGGLSIHYQKVKEIIQFTRQINPHIITILGGGLVSSDPELIMNRIHPDFGVIGEGEHTIVELARELGRDGEYDSVNGIAFFDDAGQLELTPPRAPILDIDSIPTLDYDGFGIQTFLDMQCPNDDHYMYHFDSPRAIPIIASRSCPYQCTFCYHPLGNRYRQRSLDSLFSELELLINRYKANILTIYDELFSLDKDRIFEFCRRIKPYRVKYLISMRVDGVDREILRELKNSGCFMIGYGLESASQTILNSMKKRITLPQIERALNMTYESDIAMQGNFIFSDKAETPRTADETLNFWLKHRKSQINLTALYVYPGTELYQHALEKDVIIDPIQFLEYGCPPKNISQMDDDEYSDLLGKIYKLRIENPVPAAVSECKKSGTDKTKGDLFDIKVTCPHCLQEMEYKNMHENGTSMFILGLRIGCKNCNQRFDILPFNFYTELHSPGDLETFIEDILHGYNTVAIYGAGRGGAAFYDYCRQTGKQVFYFIDDYKSGKFCGIQVIKPEKIHKHQLPDITVFAGISPDFISGVEKKMVEWKATPTLTFSRTNSFKDNRPMKMYYLRYYNKIWLPLLNKGIRE